MLERMARLVSLIVRHAGAYGDLIADDMQCAYTALARRLWVGVILVVAVVFALALACVGVIALTWDTPNRLPMIAGLFGVFVFASIAALIGLRNQQRQQQVFIPQAGLEWQKDRRLLDDLLVKTRDASL
jgi:uncharacterized membrane protein YqjE